jgi:thioredoxin 1
MKRIIRFTASWCGPCKALAKTLEEINSDQIIIEVVDIDVDFDLALEYGVRGVPTLIMFDEHSQLKRLVGNKPKAELEEWLNS